MGDTANDNGAAGGPSHEELVSRIADGERIALGKSARRSRRRVTGEQSQLHEGKEREERELQVLEETGEEDQQVNNADGNNDGALEELERVVDRVEADEATGSARSGEHSGESDEGVVAAKVPIRDVATSDAATAAETEHEEEDEDEQVQQESQEEEGVEVEKGDKDEGEEEGESAEVEVLMAGTEDEAETGTEENAGTSVGCDTAEDQTSTPRSDMYVSDGMLSAGSAGLAHSEAGGRPDQAHQHLTEEERRHAETEKLLLREYYLNLREARRTKLRQHWVKQAISYRANLLLAAGVQVPGGDTVS